MSYDCRTPRLSRRFRFRLLAVLIGLLPLGIAETILRMTSSGHLPATADPFVQFSVVRPLFQLNSDRTRYEIPASRQPYFKPDSFSAQKAHNGFRVFCFGGSTVQGNPYSIETAFTTWLRLSLQAADPNREWEVVNCGGISYASYRLAPILRECLEYQPDLLVLYVGDNEFLEDRSFTSTRKIPGWLHSFSHLLGRSYLFHFARDAWTTSVHSAQGSSAGRTSLNAEVEALLDYQGGLAQYHRDPDWRRGVADHFQFALSSMLAEAKAASVPVFVVDPVSNVKDCPPFKVELHPNFSSDERNQFTKLLADAEALPEESAERIELLEKARSLDESHAGLQFQLGHAYLAARRDDEARRALMKAKDEDVCPLRMTEPLRQIQNSLVRDFGVPLVPCFGEIAQRSPHGIPGDEWLLDHVHPTITGHQVIADLLLSAMTQQGVLKPSKDWKARRQVLYQEHLATLDAPYYARGQEHLEGLRRWAKGRVNKLRSP